MVTDTHKQIHGQPGLLWQPIGLCFQPFPGALSCSGSDLALPKINLQGFDRHGHGDGVFLVGGDHLADIPRQLIGESPLLLNLTREFNNSGFSQCKG